MPKKEPHARTRGFLTDVRQPKHVGKAEVDETVAEQIMPLVAKCQQEAAALQLVIHQAEAAEADTEIARHYEQMRQTARSIQRVAGDLEKHAHELQMCFRQLGYYETLMQATIDGEG